jgi:MFS family permease
MLHAIKAFASYPGGRLADRFGNAPVILLGWAMYAAAYTVLAFTKTVPVVLLVMAFYGLYPALTEGAERALLAELSPTRSRGRAFGLFHALTGVAALISGLLFGALWNWYSSAAAFVVAAVVAGLSALLLFFLLPLARASEG